MKHLPVLTLLFGLSLVACGPKEKKAENQPKPTEKSPQKTPDMAPAMAPGKTTATPLETAPKMVQSWAAAGLNVPESVMYDPKAQVLYVSNIGVKPTDKNKKGYIAQVGLDGTVKKLKWVTGLNAPKGMGIVGDTLYVTDLDRVVAISIPKGAISKVWNVKGAKFLNDIASDKTGALYITDMMAKKLHILRDGKLELFMDLPYGRPNGLYMQGSTLWLGTAQGLVKVDPATKKISLEIEHKGGIDGLKLLGQGRFLVSDWKGKVEIIQKGMAPVVLSDTSAKKVNAADFEYIPEKSLIIVPTFFDNRIVAYTLK